IDHHELALAVARREGGAQCGEPCGARQPIGVVARLRRKDDRAAPPDRRPAAAGASPPGALLLPGLLPAATDEMARLRGRGAGAPGGELALHHVVQQVLAHRTRDNRRGNVQLAHLGTRLRHDGNRHRPRGSAARLTFRTRRPPRGRSSRPGSRLGCRLVVPAAHWPAAPVSCAASSAGTAVDGGFWTMTVPLRAPGTAPRTRMRWSSGRTATTSRLRVVTRSAP